MKIISKEQIC